MITLVATVLNGRDGVMQLFDAIQKQSRCPDEIVIVDAGSNDGTWEFLQKEAEHSTSGVSVIALQDIGCNSAKGRNLAIKNATGDVVVSTDIGCGWDPPWFESLTAPFSEDDAIELVIGSWGVKHEHLKGPWALTEWAIKGDQKLVAGADTYSSNRSIAYRKKTWEALGGYPEDLTFCGDDASYHYLMEKAGVKRVGAPEIHCSWERHEALKGFFTEVYKYGLGEGEALLHRIDMLLVGGRMLLEFIGLFLGLIVVFFQPLIGSVLLLAFVISAGARISRLSGAACRLRGKDISHPLFRVLLYTYGTKYNWLKGYLYGFFRGYKHCKLCRKRLRQMTPELYREKLKFIS